VLHPANPTLCDDILRVALSLVEHKGPAGIMMREVAAALGYSATAIYQHFVSKEELPLTLKLQVGDLLAEEMEVGRRESTLEEQLHGMAHRYQECGLENPAYYHLIFQDTLSGLRPGPEHLARLRRSWLIVRETVAAWIEARGMSDVVADHEANVTWAIAHDITSLALSNRLPLSNRDEPHTLLNLAIGHWVSGVLIDSALISPHGNGTNPQTPRHSVARRSE
jgi:AcrR family transcriptional regulator